MAAVIACAGLALSAADASARGLWGHGFSRSVSVNRGPPGTVNRSGSVQFNNGRGYNYSNNRSCSGGTCSGSGTTTFNNGQSWSHTGTATYGNGTATWDRASSGSNGATVNRTGSCTSGAGCSRTITSTPPQ
jgi:hypothetical protein